MRNCWSIKSLLYIILAVLLIPLSALLLYPIYRQYQKELQIIEARSYALARDSAADISSRINDARYILDNLVSRPRIRAFDRNQCDPILRELKYWHRDFANLTTIDREGWAICDAISPAGKILPNYSHRRWYRDGMAMRSFVIGPPVIGGTTHLWLAPLVQPVVDTQGTVDGFISLVVDLARFKPFFVRRDYPAGTELLIVDSNGLLVAHSCDDEANHQLGNIPTDAELLAMIKKKSIEGAGRARYSSTGSGGRVVSLADVPKTGWRVVAIIPTGGVMTAARNALVISIGIVVLALAGAIGAAAFVIRKIEKPIASIAATARAHQTGDVTMRAIEDGGCLEIATFARQFNLMLDARDQSEQQLVGQKKQLDAAVNNMSQGLVMFDAAERLVVWNEPYVQMYAVPREIMRPGLPVRRLIKQIAQSGLSADDSERYVDELTARLAEGKAITRHRNLTDGRTIRVIDRPLADGGWVATHEDITAQLEMEQRIADLAHHDALTKLPNRAAFCQGLEDALAGLGAGASFALLYLDLDHFKRINDTLGHPVGDELLKVVAARLRACVRKTDLVARLGGDEFAILQTPLGRPSDAATLAKNIAKTLSSPFCLDGHQLLIGVSIGISIAPDDGINFERLFKNADMALYEAKDSGRGTYHFYEPELDRRMKARQKLENDLRNAVNNQEFELHYQPIIDLRTSRVVACEALLRWRHPERGIVMPGEFISVAEESGIIRPLGEWVLRQACADAANWPAGVSVAVNVSAAQLAGGALAPVVVSALATNGLTGSRLEIEITESVLMHDTPATVVTLHQLRDLGVRVAMDDFGTGYSSLSYLRSFPFDKVKIDRSFVRNIVKNESNRAIVRSITSMAEQLAITTTAEGVESNDELIKLRELGCTEIQGYFISHPQPNAEILRLLAVGYATAQSAA